MKQEEFILSLSKLKESLGPTELARELSINPTEIYRWLTRGTIPQAATIARLQPKIEALFSAQEASGLQAVIQNHEVSTVKVAFSAPQQTIFLLAKQIVDIENRLKQLEEEREKLINESIQLTDERKVLEEALVTLRKRFPSKEVKT